jgi:hypothetical protein
MTSRAFILCVLLTAAPITGSPAPAAAQQAPAGVGRPGDQGYLVVKGTQLRKEPAPTSEVTGTVMETTCVMRAIDARDSGWVLLEPAKSVVDVDELPNDPPVKREPCHRISFNGWTKLEPRMLLPDIAYMSLLAHIEIWMYKWPLPIALDVLNHRVRIGFSEDQATTAMQGFGEPVMETTETALGVTKIYVYPKASKTILIRKGRVVAITDTK